jgi:hypothetical protein
VPKLAAALRAATGQRTLVVEEVALRMTTFEAERDPVAERLPTLLLDPVALGLGHGKVTVDRARQASRLRRLQVRARLASPSFVKANGCSS